MIAFRNDDVNANSNFDHIVIIYRMIRDKFPESEIYSAITIFAKDNSQGMVYPTTPIPIPDRKFYEVDKMFNNIQLPYLFHIASHGLFHCKHEGLSYEAQKMSIIGSCNLLNTKIFIPPFWMWDATTERVCNNNGINLWVQPHWKNIEHEPFDPKHAYWLFHSWKWTPETFWKAINK